MNVTQHYLYSRYLGDPGYCACNSRRCWASEERCLVQQQQQQQQRAMGTSTDQAVWVTHGCIFRRRGSSS